MKVGKRCFPKIAGWLVGAVCLPLMGATFAPPAEGPVAFRRDRIPLDAETMVRLSRELITLARSVEVESAKGMRAAAQMLALSIALDPANATARELIAHFQKDPHPPLRDPQALDKSRAFIWRHLSWLETPAAGDQGRALADCLTDVIVVADSEHPKAKSMRGAAELGAWSSWVPSLAAYQSRATSHETAKPAPPPPAPAAPRIHRSEAGVLTPLWRKIPGSDPTLWDLAPGLLEMKAQVLESDAGESSSLVIGSEDEGRTLDELVPPLTHLLKTKHGALPPNTRIRMGGSALRESMESGQRQSVSAAAAVLLNAAMTGREPTGTIIGTVNPSGAFNPPKDFWSFLRSLETGSGGRLVLPAAVAEDLLSMIALEKPEFFLKYEVLLASNFDELVSLTENTPEDAIATSLGKFEEIRSKAVGQPIGQYLANPFVRRRLAELAQEAPYHYSAKMLAVQSGGNRPTLVPRQVMIPELRRALAPMDWLVMREFAELESKDLARLMPTYETCRSLVEPLSRYAENSEREMIRQILTMLGGIRSLDRVARGRGDYETQIQAIWESKESLMADYKAIRRKLAEAADKPSDDN